jgi:hypothetical protein
MKGIDSNLIPSLEQTLGIKVTSEIFSDLIKNNNNDEYVETKTIYYYIKLALDKDSPLELTCSEMFEDTYTTCQ